MLKAYQINDVETWAGETLEEAIAACMAETGVSREEAFDGRENCELGRGVRVQIDDDPKGGHTTVGEILDSMTRPGLVCSTEW